MQVALKRTTYHSIVINYLEIPQLATIPDGGVNYT